jgi:hypothetical protein
MHIGEKNTVGVDAIQSSQNETVIAFQLQNVATSIRRSASTPITMSLLVFLILIDWPA